MSVPTTFNHLRNESPIEGVDDDADDESLIVSILAKLGQSSPTIDGKYSVICKTDDQASRSYTLLRALGTGGYGTVFYGMLDSYLQPGELTFAAVKFLSPRLALQPKEIERFQREIEKTRSLDSKRIVHCNYSGVIGNGIVVPFYVMEFLPGRTLRDLLNQNGRLSLRQLIQIAINLGYGILELHQAGIIHRDLTPDNIKLRYSGSGIDPILMDLGLAISPKDLKRRLSIEGIPVIGKFGYSDFDKKDQTASKYQWTPQTDLFSFGCILYEMIERKRAIPINAKSPFEAWKQWNLIAETFTPPRLTQVADPLTSEMLQLIINGLLAPKRSDRTLTNAEATLNALSECQEYLAKLEPSEPELPLVKLPTAVQVLDHLDYLSNSARMMLVEMAEIRAANDSPANWPSGAVNDVVNAAVYCDNVVKRKLQESLDKLGIPCNFSDFLRDVQALRQGVAILKERWGDLDVVRSLAAKIVTSSLEKILEVHLYLEQHILDA